MKLLVKGFANFFPGLSSAGRFVEIALPMATVEDAISFLDLSREEVGLILLNNIQVTSEAQLKDGDQLELMPLLEGG